MKNFLLTTSILLCGFLIHTTCTALESSESFKWPNKAKAAVSLAYDDGLNSQLDNAVPALAKYHLKASFYLPLASDTLKTRLADWRAAAAQGHELGNHTLFHQCASSKANREWVLPQHDLDKTSAAQMIEQIQLANVLLHAIDGKTERTLTLPCLDSQASDGNYTAALKTEFIAMKATSGDITANMNSLDPYAVSVYFPSDATGTELINMVKAAAKKGTMANITFHGVGGDHLSVSIKAHEELLHYLADNSDIYWVDTFINIMRYVKANQKNDIR